jgi:fructose-1,6-bisphosphatase/inositol monophosphatase family enzyme
MSIDTDIISTILIECADAYVLPRFRNLQEGEVRAKTSPSDLVTQADIDVENHLRRVLPGLLPGSVVMGEEGVSSGEVSVDVLKDESRPVWVVDPVDGTNNFASGRREFCVMLALQQNGMTTHSWIYDVLGKEMFVAELGAGAKVNGKPISVSGAKPPLPVHGFLSSRDHLKFFEDFSEGRDGVRLKRSLFCAGHEYMAVAQGSSHFSVFSHLRPWDHLAGILLVHEAGGTTAKFNKQAYQASKLDKSDKGLVVASSQPVWDRIFDLFLKNDL